MIEYLTKDDIILMNKEMLQNIEVKKADKHKVLSKSAIEAAVQAAKDEKGDVYDKATMMLLMLVTKHPFESGNRRTAFIATRTFLALNGENPEIIRDDRVLLGIREGFYTKAEVKEWLQGNEIRPFKRR